MECVQRELHRCLFFSQQSRQDVLPVGKRAGDLFSKNESQRHPADNAKTQLTFDFVGHHCPCDAIAHLRMQFMTMPPDAKRALDLYVREVMVPFELGDASDPLGPRAQKRNHAKRRDNLGAHARHRLRRAW